MGRLIFAIDQKVLQNFWESSFFFFMGGGGHFRCGHTRALHCVNPGLLHTTHNIVCTIGFRTASTESSVEGRCCCLRWFIKTRSTYKERDIFQDQTTCWMSNNSMISSNCMQHQSTGRTSTHHIRSLTKSKLWYYIFKAKRWVCNL